MRKLSILLMLALVCFTAIAGPKVTLAWCPSTEPSITGYNVYYVATNKVVGWKGDVVQNGTNCPPILITPGTNWVRRYTSSVFVPAVSNQCTISNLIVGKTYYFAVTATNLAGLESDFSSEVEYTVTNSAPSIPQNFRYSDGP